MLSVALPAGAPVSAVQHAHASYSTRETAAPAGLTVDITTVTPSALVPGEQLELSGTVANDDTQVWRKVQAYLVISYDPLATQGELAAAANSPAESYVGDRIVEIGRFDTLGRLDVGDTSTYTLRVPFGVLDISGAEGVYTVGVQLLATDVDDSRSTEALARARTFVPLVDADRSNPPAEVDLAMLWPLRGPVLRRVDGTYVHGAALRRSLEPGGRLRRLVDLAATGGDTPLTLVTDPALLDAAEDIADGRYGPPAPPREPAGGPDQPPQTSTDEPSGPSDVAETPTETATDDPATGQEVRVSPAAGDWLQDVVNRFGPNDLVTGYGAPDEAGLAQAPRVAAAAFRAGRATTRALLGADPGTVAFAPGSVDAAELAALGGPIDDRLAVLSPDHLTEQGRELGPVLALPGSDGPQQVLVADPSLAAGGPAPDDPLSALQVRQRLLAETALLSLGAEDDQSRGDAPPAAAFVPAPQWDPGLSWPSADFFSGLQTPWLRPVPLDTLRAGAVATDSDVVTGDGPQDSAGVVDAADALALTESSARLVHRAQTLARILGGDPGLARWYDAAAALGMSSYASNDADRRLEVTRATSGALAGQLGQVTLDGSSFVILSSSRGRFGVTISNDLDRPVTVGVRLQATSTELRFEAGDPVTVGAGERETVTVDTTVDDNRVTTAQAFLVTRTGQRFGNPLVFSIRTSDIGVVVWGVLAVAGLIFVAALVRRIVRRVRGNGGGDSGGGPRGSSPRAAA